MLRLIYEIRNRIKFLLGFSRKQRDLDVEIEFHFTEAIDEYVKDGLNPAEARLRVMREFGHTGSMLEECRDSWGITVVTDLVRDIKLGARQIISNPWFSSAIVLILALGIGVNTTVFTITNSMLFKPLSIRNGDRIAIMINEPLGADHSRSTGESGIWTSYPDYMDFKQQCTSVEELVAVSRGSVSIGDSGSQPEQINFTMVTPNMFKVLEELPVLGRSFEEIDCRPGAEKVALISDTYWENRYLRDPNIIGKRVYLDRTPSKIIGVMTKEARFPYGDDLWLPFKAPTTLSTNTRSTGRARVIALLKPGVSIQDANTEFEQVASRLANAYPATNKNIGARLKTFAQYERQYREEIYQLLFLMTGAAAFVLLIVSSNVANMMLSKNLSRTFEFSVRASLGATRWRTIRLLLTESIMLSCLGGVLGLGLASLGVGAFDRVTLGAPERNYWIDFSIDIKVLCYVFVLSVLCGILFGIVPSLKSTKGKLNLSLSEGSRISGSKVSKRLSGVSVSLQFFMTFVLMFGAGLLFHSFIISRSINELVPQDQIFSAKVSLPSGNGEPYQNELQRRRFYNEVIEKLKVVPGIVDAAASSSLVGLGGTSRRVEIDGRTATSGSHEVPIPISLSAHTPGYLASVNLRLIEGRYFNKFDVNNSQLVAIVSEEFAKTHWPTSSAVGKRFRDVRDKQKWYTIIGVCADERSHGIQRKKRPPIYSALSQQSGTNLRFIVRSELNPSDLSNVVRKAIREVDSYLAVSEVGTLKQLVRREYYLTQTLGVVFMILALVGLLLASIGIYAIVSYSSVQKSKEIGIRLALGSTPEGAVRLIFGKGSRYLIVGLVLGLLIAPIPISYLPNFFQLQVGHWDPIVLTTVSFTLLIVGFFACWLPARKVANLQPASVLHRD